MTILGMMTPAVSTQTGEDDVVITNLIVVEIRGGCARWHLDLCNGKNSQCINTGDGMRLA